MRGIVSFRPQRPADRFILPRMNQSLLHRGPEDEGYYQDSQSSLAMRRLSIIDHAYEKYGDDCVKHFNKHFNGMFAIALSDARQRRLLLARDRVGIKTLDLLSKDSIQKHGHFDHEVVTKWIHEHLDGRANHSHRLWALMVFEMWQGTNGNPC